MHLLWEHSLCLGQGSIFRLVADASAFAKIILVILLGFSILSWAVIVEKIRFFRAFRRHSSLFLRRFGEGARLEELTSISRQTAPNPFSVVLAGALPLLSPDRAGKTAAGRTPGGPDDIAILRSTMNRAASTEISKMESYLTFLATTGSVAPFIGLLGTVWGVMSAFLSMGVRGSATLTVVAPGIAEALIATVAGLAAAIPAVIAYNQFLGKVREAENEITRFVSEFCDRVSTGTV